MSQAPNVPALPQRSRKGAAIMPISDRLGWVGGRGPIRDFVGGAYHEV